jgi:hypothetical protein
MLGKKPQLGGLSAAENAEHTGDSATAQHCSLQRIVWALSVVFNNVDTAATFSSRPHKAQAVSPERCRPVQSKL